MGENYIITGGWSESEHERALHTVAEYSQTGFVRYLPNMIQGRYLHACSYFINGDGETVGIVLFYRNYIIEHHYRSYWSPAGHINPMIEIPT